MNFQKQVEQILFRKFGKKRGLRNVKVHRFTLYIHYYVMWCCLCDVVSIKYIKNVWPNVIQPGNARVKLVRVINFTTRSPKMLSSDPALSLHVNWGSNLNSEAKNGNEFKKWCSPPIYYLSSPLFKFSEVL